MTASVLVPLAEGFEELETVSLVDLLRRAGLQVSIAALGQLQVTGSHGIRITADCLLAQVLTETFDLIVLPGGPASTVLRDDPRLIELLQRQYQQQRFIGAICAAPMVLAKAGLLQNHRATSYPGVLDPADPANGLQTDQAIEQDGLILTSRGPGTALDFSLVLIELLCGASRRQQVEQALSR